MSTTASTWPPSPIPPYARQTQSPLTQTLTDTGAVSLTTNTTILDAAAADDAIAISLADGSYEGQLKTIRVDETRITDGSATWTLSGTFANFTTITFDATSINAILQWGGTAWFLAGGQPTVNP